MRNSVQPRLQPVARQLEVFGNGFLLRIVKVGENAGHSTEGQGFEDHPARRHGRIVICPEIVADEISLPVQVDGINSGLPTDAPEEAAMIESDGEVRGVEIPVRTELHAHGIRDNCARGNLDLLHGFHDQDSEMVVEVVSVQHGPETGSRPETVVVWRTIANLKGKPVAGQAEVADETEMMLGPRPVLYLHSPLFKKFNLGGGRERRLLESRLRQKKTRLLRIVERRGGCVITLYTPKPLGSQENSHARGMDFPKRQFEAGMPPSAPRVYGGL